MQVVPYVPSHADELRAVCLATASERARRDDAYARFTLLMYCDPYLEHGICHMLLDDDGVARGYALGCEDYDAWKPAFRPYAERIAALGPAYAERMASELAYYESAAAEYPAHLHIDIVEEHTGGGNGRRLMEALLDQMRADGVAGVSFGVSAANTHAVGFYRHMGFDEVTGYDDGDGLVFGMRFA